MKPLFVGEHWLLLGIHLLNWCAFAYYVVTAYWLCWWVVMVFVYNAEVTIRGFASIRSYQE